MAEISLCPKCGGKAEFIKLFERFRYDGFVKCTKCNAEGRVYTSKQNAVKAWNKGKIDDYFTCSDVKEKTMNNFFEKRFMNTEGVAADSGVASVEDLKVHYEEVSKREKMIEEAISHYKYGVSHDIFNEPVTTYAKLAAEALERLKNAPDPDFGRWIPVDEKMPPVETFPDGKTYSEAVNVLTSGNKVITAIWDGIDFVGDAEFWDVEYEVITHWTPVLLPLPERPAEGDKNNA